MFRVVARAPLRTSAPASSISSPSTSSSFHTSSPTLLSARAQKARNTKKKNLLRRTELSSEAQRTRPHPVLGYGAGQEWLWLQSDLKKILVSDNERAPLGPVRAFEMKDVSDYAVEHPEAGSQYPEGIRPKAGTLNFGLDAQSTRTLFHDLPTIASQRPLLLAEPSTPEEARTRAYEEVLPAQLAASEQMARIVHLSNASAGGVAFENRRRIVEAFSDPTTASGGKVDSGRSEVQAALLTLRIHSLWQHMLHSPKDISARRHLITALNARAKILRYLKRTDRNRYDAVLPRIGVDRRAVEGEIVLT